MLPISQTSFHRGVVQFEFDRKEFLWGQRGLYFSPQGNAINDTYYQTQEQVEDGWHTWFYGGW